MLDDDAALLRDRISSGLDYAAELSAEAMRDRIEEQVFLFSRTDRVLTSSETAALVRRLYDSFRGLDVIQPLLEDATITEIMINRYNEIFIERAGNVSRHDAKFDNEQRLEDIVQSIVGKVNRAVNESSPIVDARLPDGSRINVVLPPVALKGPAVTIRKFPEQPLGMTDLVRLGALTDEAASTLQKLVRAKYNIFIGGGTGSGKTTFLNALAGCIPPGERIITIEDSAELQIKTIPNIVRLETRNANTEGKGEIAMSRLIRTSLRMRPNRIIVGEVRGAEAFDMLQAMNTGHDGSLSTGHANSSADMLSRLETMVLSGVSLPLDVIRKQIASAVDIMVHLARLRDGSRRVVEIHEVGGVAAGEILLNPLYLLDDGGGLEGAGTLRPVGGGLLDCVKLRQAGMSLEEEDSV